MMNWMKKMFIMGAMVMVMMSFAAPAMADDFNALDTSNDYFSDVYIPVYNPVDNPVDNPVLRGIPPEAGAPSKPAPPKDCVDTWIWAPTGWYTLCI